MRHYERLVAWQLCHELALHVYRATETFPKHELYGLTSQARRAAVSSAANIAEGSAKRGRADFRRYLDIALGSLSELSYTLLVARELGLLAVEAWTELDKLHGRARFMTWKLYAAIAGRSDKQTVEG
jgi:four helix bundle protein